MESNLEDLLLDIQTSPTQMDRAKAELCFIQTSTHGNFHEKLTELSEVSGEKLSYIRYRLRLLKATNFSNDLWPLVESGSLTIKQAVDELQKLEAKAGVPRKKIKTKEEIIEETIKSNPVSILPDLLIPQIEAHKKEKKKKIDHALNKRRELKKSLFLPHVDALMRSMEKFLHKKCPNLSSDIVNFLVQEMGQNIRSSVTLTKARAVSEEKINDARVEILSRKASISINESCDVLGIDRPKKKGFPIDLERAKKNMWSRVRLYHPDKVDPDDTKAQERFREATEAYAVLRTYNEALKQTDI